MNRSWKVFLAILLGGIIGGFVALEMHPYFWWVGMLVGGLVGYLAFDVREIVPAMKRAWAEKVAPRLPSREDVRVMFWVATVLFGMIFACLVVLAPYAIAAYCDISVENTLLFGLLPSIFLFGIMWRGFSYYYSYYGEDLEARYPEGTTPGRTHAVYVNPLRIIFVYPFMTFVWLYRERREILAWIGGIIFAGFVMTIGLIIYTFVYLYSNDRLVCMAFGTLGVAIGHLIGFGLIGVILGALIAATFGKVTHEIISVRLLGWERA